MKKLDKYTKVFLMSFIIGGILIALDYILVLLPTYSLAAESGHLNDKKLNQLLTLSHIFTALSYTCFGVFILSALVILLKAYRKKYGR